jgi:hypothetical protein
VLLRQTFGKPVLLLVHDYLWLVNFGFNHQGFNEMYLNYG